MEDLPRIAKLKIYGYHLYDDLYTEQLQDDERQEIKKKLSKIDKIISQYGYSDFVEGFNDKLNNDKEFANAFLKLIPGTKQNKEALGEFPLNYITKDSGDDTTK